MSIEANKQRLAELESQKAQLFSMAERFPTDESLLNKMESLLLDIAAEEIAIQIHSIPVHMALDLTKPTKVAASNDPIDRPKVANIPENVVNEVEAPAINSTPTKKAVAKKAATAKTTKTK